MRMLRTKKKGGLFDARFYLCCHWNRWPRVPGLPLRAEKVAPRRNLAVSIAFGNRTPGPPGRPQRGVSGGESPSENLACGGLQRRNHITLSARAIATAVPSVRTAPRRSQRRLSPKLKTDCAR